jgi:hypothetical protein
MFFYLKLVFVPFINAEFSSLLSFLKFIILIIIAVDIIHETY